MPSENDPNMNEKIIYMSQVLDEWEGEDELYYEGATTTDRLSRQPDPPKVEKSMRVK